MSGVGVELNVSVRFGQFDGSVDIVGAEKRERKRKAIVGNSRAVPIFYFVKIILTEILNQLRPTNHYMVFSKIINVWHENLEKFNFVTNKYLTSELRMAHNAAQ